jgi:hypothetical protein
MKRVYLIKTHANKVVNLTIRLSFNTVLSCSFSIRETGVEGSTSIPYF